MDKIITTKWIGQRTQDNGLVGDHRQVLVDGIVADTIQSNESGEAVDRIAKSLKSEGHTVKLSERIDGQEFTREL